MHGDIDKILFFGVDSTYCHSRTVNPLGCTIWKSKLHRLARSVRPVAWRQKLVIVFLGLLQHTIIQGAYAPLNYDMVKLATSPCKERTPVAWRHKSSIVFLRLLQHTIIQGAIVPLNDDIEKLAPWPYKGRTPRCMAT